MHLKQISICAIFSLMINITIPSLASEKTDHAIAINPLINKRYSGYGFDSTRPISHDVLQAIMEAGRLTPSSYNEQPWFFIICDRNTNPDAYEKAFNTLVEFNQGWAKNAPVLVVSMAASRFSQRDKINPHAQYDTGAAAFSMMLQATSLGLMTHQMGGFDEEKIRQQFSIPQECTPMSVMAIGYPLSTEIQSPRKRKPLSENFFLGAWGKGFNP